MKKFSIAACLTFAFLALASCKSANPPELPGSCSINRRDTGVYDIVGPSQLSSKGLPLKKVLVDADVSKIAIIGKIVTGYCDPYLAGGDAGTAGGYFCLNTETQKAKEGMTLIEYESYLKVELGVTKKPEFMTWRRY